MTHTKADMHASSSTSEVDWRVRCGYNAYIKVDVLTSYYLTVQLRQLGE